MRMKLKLKEEKKYGKLNQNKHIRYFTEYFLLKCWRSDSKEINGKSTAESGNFTAKAQSTCCHQPRSMNLILHTQVNSLLYIFSVWLCFAFQTGNTLVCWNSALCCIKKDITDDGHVPPCNRLIMRSCKTAVSYLISWCLNWLKKSRDPNYVSDITNNWPFCTMSNFTFIH